MTPQTSFKTANQLLREGKLDDAIAAYREAIAVNPNFPHAHHNLGEALVKAGRVDEAVAAFRQAVELNPQAVWSLFKLGELLRGQQRFEEAVGFFRQAVELKSDAAEFNLGLGAALVKLGSALEEGSACLLRAVELNPFLAEAYYYLGVAASKRQQWSEAVEFYGRGLEVNPSWVECGFGLAEALGKLGRWSEAVQKYRQMVLVSGESGEVCFGLGQALGQLGRWEEAVVEFRRAVALGFAGAEVRHHLGYALGQLGRWEEAVVEYRLVVEVNPKSAVVRHQLGYGLMRLGRWGEAEVELRRSLELYPGSAVVWQQLGDVLRELGKRDEAESAYRHSLELKSGKSGSGSGLSRSSPQMRGVSPTSLTREKTGKVEPKFDANNRVRRDGILKSQEKKSTYLNVLFVLYGNTDSNGGYHAQLHANRLLEQGVDCLFAVPDSSDNEDILRQSLHNLSNPVRILPYSAFSIPGFRLPFANGGSPDIIHAWTPREVVRKFWEKLLQQYSCPLVIHLEDNEEYLTAAKVGMPFAELLRLPEAELDRIIPGDRYHPIKGKAFMNRARGLTMIIETLKGFNIGNVPELVLAPPVDESLFYPRPINYDWRRSLGIPEGDMVLAYTGNVHSGNRDEVGELYRAVEILNQRGCPTVLLRTGLKGEEMGVESRGRNYEKYLGWVEREQVPEILAAADILVQPGVPGEFNDRRIPSKLLEYFAMGRPVVLPKSNLGLRVKHGLEGYVLARCDAEGIAGAVREIKTDGELARRLSDRAVDFYLSQVESGFAGTKLNDLYGRLTGKVSSLRNGKKLGTTFFVVTPCLNAAATIDETIRSVISQPGDFWIRYHVRDGGSMDGTVERLRYWEGVLSAGSSNVQCRGVEFSWVSEPDEGMYDGVMKGFDRFEIAPRELMTWINADDVLMPGALSAICRIVGEHPEVEWIGGPQYVFETDVRQKVLQRGTPTPTAVIREGLCDGKHWEMLQQEGTFFSKGLWLKSKHGLKGFELAGDWNFWREMAHHGVYYQYESPLGAFRRRVSQLSVERIGDYRAEIERVVPLEVRRGRFEELYREQEWGANVIKSDGGSGRMVVEVESVREVYEKIEKRLSVESRSSVKSVGSSRKAELDQPTISAMLQRSQAKIRQFHNKHLGQRCVIIGNGPSLNEMDLSFLRHEICFGMNKIYLGFERWNFTPTYYVAVNEFAIEQSVDEIRKMSCPKFIGNRGISGFEPTDDIIFMKTFPPPGEAFSKRADVGLEEGATVTYVAMQLAYYMGFSEVVLIGVDHHFVTQGTPHKTVVSDGDDPNHFDPSYFGKGLKWQLPDLVGSEKSYRVAKQVFEESGRRIIDATVNGRCQVFMKQDYRLVFKESLSNFSTSDIISSANECEQAAIYYDLGNVKLKEKKDEEAVHYYRKAIKFNPNLLAAYYKILEIKPELTNLYLQLGDALARNNKNNEANIVYKIARSFK